MMMPSTMILTICISMVLKRNRGLSLDIGSRLAGSGLGWGGVEADPQTKIFSHQCGGHLQPVGGLNPHFRPDKSNAASIHFFYLARKSSQDKENRMAMVTMTMYSYHVQLRLLQSTCIKLSRRRSARYTHSPKQRQCGDCSD